MFDHRHYVPILKGKEGEYGALRELTAATKERLTPLIEIPSIPYDFVNETPAKSVDAHLERVAEKIEGCWGRNRPLFIDLLWIPSSETTADGRRPLTYVFDNARIRGIKVIPVTGLNREPEYQDAVKNAVKQDGLGICIRLENDDFEELSDLDTRLNDALTFFELSPRHVDLLIDFKSIAASQPAPIIIAATSIIASLPSIRDWRTLTLASSAFPQDLSNVDSGSATPLPRTEWSIWESLAGRRSKLARLPTFGDYAISNPFLVEVDPRLMKMSAQLRYTTDKEWLIFKGRNVRDYGYEQFNDICRQLISRPEFRGGSFSWGDTTINDCAGRSGNPGNATTWRKIGTNHHLTSVTEQIASFPGL